MKRRSLLLLLATIGCHRESDGAVRLRQGLLEAARLSGCDEERVSWGAGEVARLIALAKRELSKSPARAHSALLSALIFEQWGFVREVEDASLQHVLLPNVLEHRRGSCVGLGSLFLAIAEGLGWSAAGVLRPGHFYVRVHEPARSRNVELLRLGEAMPDAWYEQRFPIPGGSAGEYARPLTSSEVLGVVHFNVGNERRRKRRFAEARAAFERAARAFPELAEAHASLGALQHLLGDLEGATSSYQRAKEANPHLPGVAENLSLLEAERSASAGRR